MPTKVNAIVPEPQGLEAKPGDSLWSVEVSALPKSS